MPDHALLRDYSLLQNQLGSFLGGDYPQSFIYIKTPNGRGGISNIGDLHVLTCDIIKEPDKSRRIWEALRTILNDFPLKRNSLTIYMPFL